MKPSPVPCKANVANVSSNPVILTNPSPDRDNELGLPGSNEADIKPGKSKE